MSRFRMLGSRLKVRFTRRRCHSVRYLLRYRELRVGNYLPTAIQFLEDMKAAVRLGDFLAILHSLGGSAVGHHHNVRAEHLELVVEVFRRGPRTIFQLSRRPTRSMRGLHPQPARGRLEGLARPL